MIISRSIKIFDCQKEMFEAKYFYVIVRYKILLKFTIYFTLEAILFRMYHKFHHLHN